MGQTCATNTGAVAPNRRQIQVIDENFQTQTTPPSKCLQVVRGSKRFKGLTQGFNRRFEASNCQVIYLPTNDCEAMDALTDILGNAEYCANFSIVSGRHCYESLVYNPNILAIIDISLMTQLSSTNNQGTIEYSAEAGGTNWMLTKELYLKFGRVIPGGSCYSVGLGGHICGGGYGLLSRKYGLTIDYLSGVDILCVDGHSRKACLKQIREDSCTKDEALLLWACQGGGGGNFGLITRYYFKNLPEALQNAYIETLSIRWKDVTREKFRFLLHAFWEFVYEPKDKPDEKPYFVILKLMHSSAGEIPITFQSSFDNGGNDYVKNITDFKNILECKGGIKVHHPSIPLIGHPSSNGILSVAQEMNWFEAAQTLNGSGPNQCGKYKSSYMRKPFPEYQCDALFTFLTMTTEGLSILGLNHLDKNNPNYEDFVKKLNDEKLLDQLDFKQSLVQVDSYGGQINTVQSNATAIPQRSSNMKLQYQTYWAHDPNQKDAAKFHQFQDWIHRLWVDTMYEDVYKETGGLPDPYYQAKPDVQEEGGASPIVDLLPYSSCVYPKITPPDSRVVDGAYYNYIDVDMVSWVEFKYKVGNKLAQDAVLRLYFEDNLERLVEAKKKWDPLDIFKHELSIPLKLSEQL